MMKNEVQLRNGSTHVEAYVQKDAQWMLEANWESFLLIGGGLQIGEDFKSGEDFNSGEDFKSEEELKSKEDLNSEEQLDGTFF